MVAIHVIAEVYPGFGLLGTLLEPSQEVSYVLTYPLGPRALRALIL